MRSGQEPRVAGVSQIVDDENLLSVRSIFGPYGPASGARLRLRSPDVTEVTVSRKPAWEPGKSLSRRGLHGRVRLTRRKHPGWWSSRSCPSEAAIPGWSPP